MPKRRNASFDSSQHSNAEDTTRRAQKATQGVIRTYGNKVLRRIEQKMREPKHGRSYPRPNGRIHIASAPGEAPAVDTGNLLRSMGARYYRKRMGHYVNVGTGVDYAFFLETGKGIAKRPFIAPVFAEVRTAVGNDLAVAIVKASRRTRE